jgi:hypothetical protein
VIEFFGAITLILGVWTRPPAALFALFTLAVGLVGHRYWTMTDADRFMNMINLYKKRRSRGGFFLLYVTGAGKYSIDGKLGLPGTLRQRTQAPCTLLVSGPNGPLRSTCRPAFRMHGSLQ